MRDRCYINACEVEDAALRHSTPSSCLSWSSDGSSWAATSDDTVAREIDSMVTIESTEDMVSLRNIHQRLALETTRSAFWELLAKRVLAEAGWVNGAGHGDPAASNKATEESIEAGNVIHLSEKECVTLEEMVGQMQALGSSLEVLKERAAKDQRAIAALRDEVKRTDRLKNGYKRQIAELKSTLEARDSLTMAQASSARDDTAHLQRKLAEMRVQMESLKRERDAAESRAGIAQGRHDELQGRYSRREHALMSAQRRCRDLEDVVSRGRREGAGQKTSNEEHADVRGRCISVDAGTCMMAMPNDLIDTRDGDRRETKGRGDEHTMEPSEIESQDHISGNDIGGNEEYGDDDAEMETRSDTGSETVVDAIDETVAGDQTIEVDERAGSSSPVYISTSSPAYRQIFGDATDLDGAAHVLISADRALASCAARILQLTQEVCDARNESDELKTQCAEQYDRVFKYKTMCSSLAAKVKTLEAHIATIKHSADEYQRQMELLVERQRAAAAEESHKLESEVQTLSQEQARLLLKLHAVQLDLDKSRALSAEMSRRCQSLEANMQAMRGGNRSCPGTGNQVRQLESIAAGLKVLAGSEESSASSVA